MPTKLANLDNITALSITGLDNAHHMSGSYKKEGQINYFFYNFKDKSIVTLKGAKGLTTKGNTLPFDIATQPRWNTKGLAVGTYVDTTDAGKVKGFIYHDGDYALFNSPDDGSISEINSFNDQGQILGNYAMRPAYKALTTFLYQDGASTTLPLPTWKDKSVNSLNAAQIDNSGQIVGQFPVYFDTPVQIGFLYSNGSYTFFDGSEASIFRLAINDKGQVVIFYTHKPDGALHSVLYDHGAYSFFDPPFTPDHSGINASQNIALNNNGQWVGNAIGYNVESFIYSKGEYSELKFPRTGSTQLYAINDNGQILGGLHEDGAVYQSIVANPIDSFDPTTQVLHLNNLEVNGVILHDIAIGLKKFELLSQGETVAKGSIANEITNPLDSFDTNTQLLTLNAVVLGDKQYNQVILKLLDYQLLGN